MEFGELKDVNLREAWPHEANDFTPWLADNLEQLSHVIGIPLEAAGTEVAVEGFAADILARNPVDGSRVLIENQLEGTDHTHLGQILTYLAGLEAQTIIWVAREFREPHLSAIRWLNEHTVEPFAFFAVRVKVVRIGDNNASPVAPIFEVQERPSGWDRQIRAIAQQSGLTETGQFRREFWAHYALRHPDDGIPTGSAASSVWHEVEDTDLVVGQYLSRNDVGVYLRGRRGEPREVSAERAARYVIALKENLGVDLDTASWGGYGLQKLLIDSHNRQNWLEMADWLHDRLMEYRRVLTEKKQENI